MARLMRTYSDAGDLQDRIVALGNSGKILPGNDEAPYDYLERLYHLAKVQMIQEDKDYDQLKTRFDQMKALYEEKAAQHQQMLAQAHAYPITFDETVDLGTDLGTTLTKMQPGSFVPAEKPKSKLPAVEKPRGRMLRIKKKS